MAGSDDLGNPLKQALKMRRVMDLARAEIAELTIEGIAGGGGARVEVDGYGGVKSIHLSEEVLGSGDAGAVEDLVLAALKDAQTRAAQMKRERLAQVTGSMDLPDFF